MPVGNLLIYLTFIFTIVGIITSFLRLKTKEDRFLMYSRIVTVLLFTTISFILVFLYILFFTADVNFDYVWRYTSVTHPFHYKFAGVIAGLAGSLLFWIWAIITPWFYEEIRIIKRSVNNDTRDWIRIFVFIVMAILIFILILYDLFKPTAANLLNLYPNGQGLNPLLQTELMVIHPFIVFLSYGILVLPFAASIANLITGDKNWISYSLKWSRVGWLLLTLGIGLGALWAYIVLGWGGYWGWDPVETSSLLPWIILTGFLHAQLMFKRKNDYKILTPVLGVFSFILIIFATFVTRAGGLWVSVHTFGEANVQIDPLQRFINLLGENQTVLIYMLFIISILLITSFLIIYRYSKIKKSSIEQYFTISELISDDILMLFSVFLFIITTIITFLILIMSVNGIDPRNFDLKVGVFILILVLVLIFCMLWRYTGRKLITIIGICTLIASVIGFIFFKDSSIIAASIPILVVALIGSVYKIIRSFNRRKIRRSINLVSAHLIHFSIILIVLGYVGSNFLVEEHDVSLNIIGDGEDINKYTFYATDFGQVEGINFVEIDVDQINYFYQTEYVDIKISEGNNVIGTERLIVIMSTSLINGENKLLRNEIKVLGTLSEDIYLTYKQAHKDNEGNIDRVDVNVKIIPLMKLLWFGIWFMAIGMILRIASENKLSDKTKELDEKKIKSEKYYKDMVEKELEK
ncbi:MAG: hypothetical protein AYK22_03710 [Thermoplasmatales archaeon SG8-52-3]|nr:MAG: hypothetical protein AYK22_03710 [Thermoplasmatales archaeon SG8-52-3]